MRNTCVRTLSLLWLSVFMALSRSMAAENVAVLHGQLRPPAPELVQGLFVIVEERSTHTEISRVDARIDGSFDFHEIPSGDYTFRVIDGFGQTVCQQIAIIEKHMPPLEIHLPEREPHDARGGAGTVSVRQLMHPPDKKAVRAFESALRFSSAGKYGDAASELEKAIRISPEFGAAHANLAVQYFRLDRVEESIAESERAIQIGGPDPRSLCNLASAQARLERYAQAEKSARAALRLDAGYVKANLILGSILTHESATRGEGLKHLQKATAKFASAWQLLEQLQASQ
jgi:hypothetical protein